MLTRLFGYYRLMISFRKSGHIPVWYQLLEMSILFLVRRIGPGYYLMGRFGRPELKLRDKLAYYNGPAYGRQVRRINDRHFHKVSHHKVVESALLNFFNVETPKSYGFFHTENGQSRCGDPLRTPEHLDALLAKKRIERFVMKPSEGAEGRGFVAAERKADGFIRPLNAEKPMPVDIFVNQLLNNPAGYLLQEYFTQHPELSELNPTSVNTIRMMVYRPTNQWPVCFGAFLRMGRQNSLVDNVSNGGILGKIDIETGEVGEGCFFRPAPDTFDHHPDTGASITGKKLPFWNEAKELSSRALVSFPNIRFVGLDIAIGPDGPVIIELNVHPDYGDFAVLRIPSRRALSDPYYE